MNQLSIIHDRSIGETPAQVDRVTGEISVNPDIFYALTPFQQQFVLQHEIGHYTLDTSSEIEADAYAFDQLVGTEFRSLKQSLGSISELLSDDNDTKRERYKALYIRVLKWDAKHGNTWAKEELEKLVDKHINYFSDNLNSMNTIVKKIYIDALPSNPSAFYLTNKGTYHRSKYDAINGLDPLNPYDYIIIKPSKDEIEKNPTVIGRRVEENVLVKELEIPNQEIPTCRLVARVATPIQTKVVETKPFIDRYKYWIAGFVALLILYLLFNGKEKQVKI